MANRWGNNGNSGWLFSWAPKSLQTVTAAAAAAKSLQSCPTLCDLIDGSPPGSPRPWDSPGKNTGVGCHFLLQCMKVKSESEVVQLTAAHQAPPSVGFSRQEYWSGVPLPSLDDDCRHEIKRCLLLGRKAMTNLQHIKKQRYYFADKSLV